MSEVTLPVTPLATATIELAGQKLEIRSLSRDEVVQLARMDEDTAGAEVFTIARGTGCTDAAATQWRKDVSASVADELLAEIAILSGIRSREVAGKG